MFCTSMTALQDGNELAVEVLVQLFFWLVFGFIAAAVAAGRGRSVVGWFFLGAMFSCFGLVLLLCLPDLKKQEAERHRQENENRRLREQIAKERQVSDIRHSTLGRRLSAHDQALGLDTETAPTALLAGSGGVIKELPPPLPDGSAQWFYARGSERLGPVLPETIRHLLMTRSIAIGTLVWRPGMSNWQPIETVPEFLGGDS
ncbi:hypothetical protein LBMAG49_24750 [Planctomycetota bacterium]|nr:hypothetical protein LBMAG49_24750 [Planctomycetota bacterium]